MKGWLSLGCVIGALLIEPACVESTSTVTLPDRQALLRDIADGVVLPLYRDFHGRAQTLAASVESLCAKPDTASLNSAREAWRSARVPWKQAEAMRIGPVVDLRIDSAIDFWPVSRDDVQAVLDDDALVDDAYVDGLGARRKGLPVLELLIFEPEDTKAALAGLSDGAAPTRRCVYAAALARDVAQQAARLVSAWEPAEGNFAAELVEAGRGSSAYPTQVDAINDVVNQLIDSVRRLESNKLGKPLGRQDGGTPQPDVVEAPFAHQALVDAKNHVIGLEAIYLGRLDEGPSAGLDAVLARTAPRLAADLRSQLTATKQAIDGIDEPLELAVVSDPAPVIVAFDAAHELLRMFSADMAGALGATVTFSDNDGD